MVGASSRLNSLDSSLAHHLSLLVMKQHRPCVKCGSYHVDLP